MIDYRDIEEIRSRDFMEFHNHIDRFDNIHSKKIWGNNKRTFVSILMPIYNHPTECLKNAISSALNQLEFEDYKIIIVDNNQTTVNEKVILPFHSEKIVYYRNEKNLGLFGNWNRCVKLANSEWITFLHSDDMLCEDFLRTMCKTVMSHPEIDQLACKYTIYDIQGTAQCCLGKHELLSCKQIFGVDYIESMITSIKGAFIKQKYLLEIGGFRDKDNGLGLGDYTAMLQYAYKHNTYLLDGSLYLNGWGENDTINTEIWYPELVSNYYMQIFFAESTNKFRTKWKKYRAKMILLQRASKFDNGTSFVGKRVPINWEDLKHDCGFKSLKLNPFLKFGTKVLSKFERTCRDRKRKKFSVQR